MGKIYIVRGVPGSGKSTIANEMTTCGMADIHAEADMFMLDDNGDCKFDPKNLSYAHGQCKNRIRDAMAAGVNAVVSNTFVRHWEYQEYIKMAEEYGYDYTVLVCSGNFKNEHGVPDCKVEEMKRRFEF